MYKSFLIFHATLFFAIIFTSCSGEVETEYNEKQEEGYIIPHADYDTYLKECIDMENKINSNVNNPDKKLLEDAMVKFQDFAGFFPDDVKSPDYLFKASDYALTLGKVEKSIKILNQIINDYPNYAQMESVLFNKASHLDFEMRDTTLAKQTYKEFIAKYPNSDLVDDAQSRIENIALSLEELADKFIKDLEKKPQ